MFAPEGYISLDEIVLILDEISKEWRLETPHEDDPKPGGEFDLVAFQFIDDVWHRSGAYQIWLFHCFLNRQERNLFACAPNGRALKLSLSVVFRMKTYDGPFDDTPGGWKTMVDSYSESPFWYVSSSGYKIDFERAKQFSGGMEVNPLLEKLDQYPVCWKLPGSNQRLDWLAICGVSKETSRINFDLSPTAVSKRVLAAWSDNPSLTKSTIKELVAPTLSSRQFNIAWTIAAQKNPNLVKPGRRKS